MEEQNIIIKDWRHIDIAFGLVYPNNYSVGMASYSVRFLYALLNSYQNIVCERIFLPENVRYPASRDYRSEVSLRSIETGRSILDFDILGFSIQFENDFRNILWCLEKAKMPLLNTERRKARKRENIYYPLVIGGGPVSTSNPKPLSKIFDVFFIGDAEPILEPFFQHFLDFKNDNLNFRTFLDKLSSIKGLYIPLLRNKAKRIYIQDLDNSQIPYHQLITKSSKNRSGLEESFYLEINRGCPFNCKFCISSYHNLPFRNRSFESIAETIERAIDYTEFKKFSLIGSCVSAHPKFLEICELILKNEKSFSIPSIRIDHITPRIIEILERADVKTITIAPETGSEKLRNALGKMISDERIYRAVKLIKASQIENIKMYFLIGLPNETELDVQNTIDMIQKLDVYEFRKNSLRISINPMIPKLNTPYQKEIQFYLKENKDVLRSKLTFLKNELENLKSVKLKVGPINNLIKQAQLQTLFSLGNEKVSEILIQYYRQGATFGALKQVLNRENFSLNEYFLKVKGCYSPWEFD